MIPFGASNLSTNACFRESSRLRAFLPGKWGQGWTWETGGEKEMGGRDQDGWEKQWEWEWGFVGCRPCREGEVKGINYDDHGNSIMYTIFHLPTNGQG